MEEMDHVSHTFTNINPSIKKMIKKSVNFKSGKFVCSHKFFVVDRPIAINIGLLGEIVLSLFSILVLLLLYNPSELFERHLAKKITFFFCHFLPEVHHHMAELWPRYESIAVLIFFIKTKWFGNWENFCAAYIIKHVESLLDVDGHKFLVDL